MSKYICVVLAKRRHSDDVYFEPVIVEAGDYAETWNKLRQYCLECYPEEVYTDHDWTWELEENTNVL